MTATQTRMGPRDLGKPLLRGWLHAYAFVAAVVAGAVLTTLSATVAHRATFAIALYSVSVCTLFGTSALYHRRVWAPRAYQIMRRLDHSMIFLFIAGTYTPFSVLLLPRTKAIVILAVVWGGAVLGVGLKLISPNAPRWLSAPLYVALGWVAIAVLPDILARGGAAAFVLLLCGGAFYTLGGVCYAMRRPNLWPGVFGHHEFFHACTVIAAVCHQIAIYFALFA